MMIDEDGIECRNIQEQVEKNRKDILKLKRVTNIKVEENANLTYLGKTYVVPKLTADNVTTIFNILVKGWSAIITDATGNTHYSVKQVDTDGDNLFVIIDYFGKFSVEYELDENDDVNIKGVGGSASVHSYEHNIFIQTENRYIYTKIITHNNAAFDYFELFAFIGNNRRIVANGYDTNTARVIIGLTADNSYIGFIIDNNNAVFFGNDATVLDDVRQII